MADPDPSPTPPLVSLIRSSREDHHPLRKRIVMNPPPSFIQYAAYLQPSGPQMNGEKMMISSNGQAVLLAPNANTNANVDANPNAVGTSQSSPAIGASTQQQQQNPAQDSSQTQSQNTPHTVDQGIPPQQVQAPTQPQSNDDTSGSDGQVVLKGDKVVLVAPTDSLISTPSFTASDIIASASATSTATASASSITSASAITSAATVTSIDTPSTAAPVPVTSISPSSTISTTGSFPGSSSTTSSTSPTSASHSPTSSSTSTSTPAAQVNQGHKPPSAGIIFLIILLSLAIFVALVSLFRYLVKSWRMSIPCSCLRRRRDEDDDDGLSDLVRGFDTPRTLGGGGYNPYLHATSYPTNGDYQHQHQQHENGSGDEISELERRSSLFTREKPNGTSPFLHSQSASPNSGRDSTHHNGYNEEPGYPSNMNMNMNIALPQPPQAAYRAASAGASLPHHLFGETGPLEVRNALPGEVDRDHEHDHNDDAEQGQTGIDGLVGLGLGQGSPRFLGVDGTGLPVPWSTPLPPRPSSIDSFDNHHHSQPHQAHPNPFGSSSTLAPGTGPPLGFVSPSLSHDEILPQRSATWANNLRNTLYNAISAARAPSALGNNTQSFVEEDKFTTTVGNIYRGGSNRRKAIPTFDLEKGNHPPNGLVVVDEKDDSQSTLGVGMGMGRQGSVSSDGSTMTLTIPHTRMRKGAGERFKGYYTRSKSSTNVSMTEGVSSENGEVSEAEEVEDMRPPTRLAGGARAAGARTGSFVIV
ncbi:uncharacterized protein I303_105768 [Kwoniella dejecticola CBS 10117]|uniref:Uncharacterized protein n=1 Tax=Kwoniella dejecticola CBS 10117 TaxID=1296121 RepID=A0A1A6A0C3_9TREE|nr:uncharacterized protein I303_05790 [Kwoniella dejecticola CBS 10117]OBR83510.1 hypothetical protein I303_05790 [Kwoniella dejecticola CBS 10117]